MLKSSSVLLLLLIVISFSQSPLFLWEVKGAQNTVYIAGSIHVLNAESYPLDARFDKAYHAAEKVICEVDMDSMSSNWLQGYMLGLAMFKGGKTLRSELSAENYTLMKEMAESIGVPMAPIERFRPWYATIFITMQKLSSLGFSSIYGVDKHFYERAKDDEKLTGGLEDAKAQIDLLVGLEDMEVGQLIRQTYNDLKVVEKDFNEMRGAWESGDVEKMDSIMKFSLKDMPDFEQKLLYDRNERWLPKIEAFLNDTIDYLVIGGAAHMTGDQGVISLLKKRGYTPQQQ